MEKTLSLYNLFGGIPFLDRAFKSNQFLTAVACSRQFRYENLGYKFNNLEEYLIPSNALIVYSQFLGKKIYLHGIPADKNIIDKLEEQIERITNQLAWWKPLFNIPLSFYVFKSDTIIGTSSAMKPQHIFLSSKAMISKDEIREQVLHEVVHIWAYMIEELWLFHNPKDTTTFSLPSGIKGKTATGVIHAAYVARILSYFYKNSGEKWKKRSTILTEYFRECLQLIESYQFLTNIGEEIRKRLSNS